MCVSITREVNFTLYLVAGYIEPRQRAERTVGSVGGGKALGKGGRSPVLG